MLALFRNNIKRSAAIGHRLICLRESISCDLVRILIVKLAGERNAAPPQSIGSLIREDLVVRDVPMVSFRRIIRNRRCTTASRSEGASCG